MRKLRIGVIYGGRSSEHEVSLVSAQSILKALDPEKYDVVPIGISKRGLLHLHESQIVPVPEATEFAPEEPPVGRN